MSLHKTSAEIDEHEEATVFNTLYFLAFSTTRRSSLL